MKKLASILFLFSLIFLGSNLFSQSFLGLSAGYMITNPHGSSSDSHYDYNIDYNSAFFVSFDYRAIRKKRFSLGTSAIYLYQNTNYNYTTSGGGGYDIHSTDATVQYGYLDFYIFPEFSFGKKAQFYFDFGPYAGVRLHSNASGVKSWIHNENPPVTGSDEFSGSGNDYLNKITIGFQLGIGMRFPVTERINIHADFSNRIGSVDFDTEGDVNFLTKMMFSAGVELKIRNKKNRPKTEAVST